MGGEGDKGLGGVLRSFEGVLYKKKGPEPQTITTNYWYQARDKSSDIASNSFTVAVLSS
jgi:hypothetical protein